MLAALVHLIQFLSYVMTLFPSLFFVFQGDVNIHMIYKSGGQEGLHDLLNGKIMAKDMSRIINRGSESHTCVRDTHRKMCLTVLG